MMQTTQYPVTSAQQTICPGWAATSYKTEVDHPKHRTQTIIIECGVPLYDRLHSPLEKMGHTVYRQSEITETQERLMTQSPHLVLIATTTTNGTGLRICARLRQRSPVPIVLFTDSHHPDSIIQAYELGADTVIPIPFVLREVETRIAALLRRSNRSYARFQPSILSIGGITLDDLCHIVKINNQVVDLSPTDYRLLRYFMQHVNYAISKAKMLQEVWGSNDYNGSNLVEVAIRRLRQKIEEDASNPQYLITVHKIGYKFVQPNLDH